MSEEQQQSLKDFPYEAVALPNTVPPMAHNQMTMPRDCIIPPAEITQDNNFPLPPVTYSAYREPCRPGYSQYYGPPTANDSTTNTHRVPAPAYPAKQLNNVATVHPHGPVRGIAYGQPSLDITFHGVAENVPAPPVKGVPHGFDDEGYNNAVPGTSIANIYRDLSVRFINNPQSNIVMFRMESLPNNIGRSRVTIELDVVGV